MDKLIKLFSLLFIVLGLSIGFVQYQADDSLHVYFLDVGQGDSVLIETPDHKFALIDGGPDSSVLSELGEVLPFWVRKIDLVVLTHPDADHLTGLVDVIATYHVDKVLTTGVEKQTGIYKEFENELEGDKIENEEVDSTSDFTLGCCIKFDLLWPTSGTVLSEVEPVNNTSIAINLIYGDFELFLAGDIETATEQELVKLYDLDSDFLKISHHGSKTSSTEEFLEDVDAEVAFISVGKDNKFGHPKPEILERLEEYNLKVYRTDTMGRIDLKINGGNYDIKCEISCS